MAPYVSSTTSSHGPQGSYVVLRVPDLEQSAQFYRSIGLTLTEERHGDGPLHYSFPLSDGMVCELYPLRSGAQPPTPGIRIGFQVEDCSAVHATMASVGASITPGTTPGSFVVLDPSGNQVEISPKIP